MKYSLVFLCVHNSCRSQMAEGFAKKYGSDIFNVYSAGTEKYHEVKPLAIKVMEQANIDMSDHYPKLLNDIVEKVDILITMGCNVECPYMPNTFSEDWGLKDPSSGPIDDYIVTRDLIEKKVLELIERVKQGKITL